MSEHVVITGMGAVTPLGVGVDPLIDRWMAGDCAIADGIARCAEFEARSVMSAAQTRRTARFVQLAVGAAEEALAGAGWTGSLPYEPERVGCIVGTGIGGFGVMEEQAAVMRERGPKHVSPRTVPLIMANGAAGELAIRYGFRGHVYAVVSACAAGAHAIGAGARAIVAGDADAVVVGGAEAALTPLSLASFRSMGALSPTGVSRPFDARRDGFVMGEGAGLLVLEEAEAAAARGARILGEVRGYGSTDDAHHITAPQPSGEGAARAMELALEEAALESEDVHYVNAHGTSTLLNDRVETAAIKRVLGERAAGVPVSSTKSAIGHLIGAAGAVEAIATILALRKRVAPPTLGLEQPEDGLNLDFVPGSARPLPDWSGPATPPRVNALSNSFGFGGHNVSLCLATA